MHTQNRVPILQHHGCGRWGNLVGACCHTLAHVETLVELDGLRGGGGRIQHLLQQSALVQSPAVVHAEAVAVVAGHGTFQDDALEIDRGGRAGEVGLGERVIAIVNTHDR